MYDAIFIDIDGTLRNSNGEISNRNIDAINKIINKGTLVVICSGRPRFYVSEISKISNASKYIISSNGAEIYDILDNKILSVSKIPKDAVLNIYELCDKQKIRCTLNAGDVRYLNKSWHFDSNELKIGSVEEVKDILDKNNIAQIVVSEDRLNKMFVIKDKISSILFEYDLKISNQSRNLGYHQVNSIEAAFIDITKTNVSKGNAVIEFCKLMNIDIKNTVAIGDDDNDLSMFDVVGYSVAMKNATEKVKNEADFTTLSNNDDGVAEFLYNIVNR